MREPDTSCIIPTFNDRVNLQRAVNSALSQQGVHVEVILVDDCSDAPTRGFIAQIAAADSRVTVFLLPSNGGQGRARNIGAMLARGRLLTFLDQDDEHAPGWYRFALDGLNAHPTLGALSGDAAIIDIPARFEIAQNDLRLRGLSLVFVTNIVFRRSVFLATGGFPTSELWRGRVAGEDGVYRCGLAKYWNAAQFPQPALIHRAKEGGATVYFLDRSSVEDNRVVMTRLDEIETNGQLHAAQHAFWDKAGDTAKEVRDCVKAASVS